MCLGWVLASKLLGFWYAAVAETHWLGSSQKDKDLYLSLLPLRLSLVIGQGTLETKSQVRKGYISIQGADFCQEVTNWVKVSIKQIVGLPRWLGGREFACRCRSRRRRGFDSRDRKISWKRKLQPTPVSILAWETSWTEEPGGLQTMGSQSHIRLSMHACKAGCTSRHT